MTSKPNYAALVIEAERAVADVKDPELRRIAFEKILEDQLGGAGPPLPVERDTTKPRAPGTAQPAKAKVKIGPQSYVDELVSDGFFKIPRTIGEVKAELSNRGHHIALTSLSGPLQKLCQRKRLRRQKIKDAGKKQQTFNYSNW